MTPARRILQSILFVSQQLPWPRDSGGNIRTFHVLKALGDRFDVSLIASAGSSSVAEEGRARLTPICRSVDIVADAKSPRPAAKFASYLASLVGGVPAFVRHNANRQIAEAVRRRLKTERFDLIHLNHLDTFQYVDGMTGPPYAIDTHNVLHEYYARRAANTGNPLGRAVFATESRRLRDYELRAFRGARVVLTCSVEERATLHALDRELQIRVVPNGVDTDYFAPAADGVFSNPPHLVFVGDMAYPPNHDAVVRFAHSVLPELGRRVAGVHLTVVGRHPQKPLLRLAEERPDLSVTGFVDDVREPLRRARVFVVPLRYGSGTRLKVLAAFSMGIPTVSTTIGVEGIECRDGHDLLIADDDSAMIDAVHRLLTDRALHGRLSESCRATARERYDWRGIESQVQAAYSELEGSTTSGSQSEL